MAFCSGRSHESLYCAKKIEIDNQLIFCKMIRDELMYWNYVIVVITKPTEALLVK